MKFKWSVILGLVGLLLMMNGGFMLLCLVAAFIYQEGTWVSILISGLTTLAVGLVLRIATGKTAQQDIRKREGFLVVALGWLAMTLFGTLPYLISGAIPSFTNAFFESVSGYTTTGATILTSIETQPKAILLWRSLTHWIGGMGIIVLTIAILPLLGIGGMQLFSAESPGPTPDKMHPRIKETAKRLWLVYVALTVAEMLLLWLSDMDLFDAINHAMATMATGGFSTKDASIAAFESPAIHWIITVFMFLAGVNFTLLYWASNLKFRKLIRNEEFRAYGLVVLAVGLFVSLSVWRFTDLDLAHSFRDGFFQVVSIITTTGFVTADYTSWAPFLTVLFFILLFSGGSTGSTSGNIKMMRHVVFIKSSLLELKRQLHPQAVIPVRFNGRAVNPTITSHIFSFILIYFVIFLVGTFIMSFFGLDFETSVGTVVATLGNVGPAIGQVGPVDNFAWIPQGGKWVLCFLMLLGRLELFTILILFATSFWRGT